MTEIDSVDLAVPTLDSEDLLRESVERAVESLDLAGVPVSRLLIADGDSSDETLSVAHRVSDSLSLDCVIVGESLSLPDARTELLHAVETDWFVFQDDSKMVHTDYYGRLLGSIGDSVGAAHGRKESRSEPAYEWTRRRARRGNTAATIIRTESVSGLRYPEDMEMLEDEWTRRRVEQSGYTWSMDPHARFEHRDQDRHPTGYTEGYIGGKYDLLTGRQCTLNVPFAALTGRSPVPHAKRLLGYMLGTTEGGIHHRDVAGERIERLPINRGDAND